MGDLAHYQEFENWFAGKISVNAELLSRYNNLLDKQRDGEAPLTMQQFYGGLEDIFREVQGEEYNRLKTGKFTYKKSDGTYSDVPIDPTQSENIITFFKNVISPTSPKMKRILDSKLRKIKIDNAPSSVSMTGSVQRTIGEIIEEPIIARQQFKLEEQQANKLKEILDNSYGLDRNLIVSKLEQANVPESLISYYQKSIDETALGDKSEKAIKAQQKFESVQIPKILNRINVASSPDDFANIKSQINAEIKNENNIDMLFGNLKNKQVVLKAETKWQNKWSKYVKKYGLTTTDPRAFQPSVLREFGMTDKEISLIKGEDITKKKPVLIL